jgi:hypothetical protein
MLRKYCIKCIILNVIFLEYNRIKLKEIMEGYCARIHKGYLSGRFSK